MIQKILFVAILSIGIKGCSSNEAVAKSTISNDLLVGTWIQQDYISSSQIKWKRASDFSEDEAGMKFLANGALVDRNSGSCATLPLTFTNDQGTYKLLNNILNLTVPNSPMTGSSLKIISLDNRYLVTEYIP